MKYTPDEAFEEVKRRGRKLALNHEKKMAKLMWAVSSALAIVLVGIMGLYVRTTGGLVTEKAYGSFLLPVESGGYVLIAVIAFMAGVIITVICKKYVERKDSQGRILENEAKD